MSQGRTTRFQEHFRGSQGDSKRLHGHFKRSHEVPGENERISGAFHGASGRLRYISESHRGFHRVSGGLRCFICCQRRSVGPGGLKESQGVSAGLRSDSEELEKVQWDLRGTSRSLSMIQGSASESQGGFGIPRGFRVPEGLWDISGGLMRYQKV